MSKPQFDNTFGIDIKKLKETYDAVGRVLIDQGLSPLAASAVMSTMAQALFAYQVSYPEEFANDSLAKVLGIDEDDAVGGNGPTTQK